jgi:hypothetical protein
MIASRTVRVRVIPNPEMAGATEGFAAAERQWWALWRGSLDGMQGVRGSNPLSSTPGQKPCAALTAPESPASGSRATAICSEGRSSVRYGGAAGRGPVRPGLPGDDASHAGPRLRTARSIDHTDWRADLVLLRVLHAALFAQDHTCDLGERGTAGERCGRSAPMGCGPEADRPTRSRGQRRSAWRTLAGKADPRRLPPTSESRLGDRLVRGSPGGVWARDIPLYRRAVPNHRHGGPQHAARSNRAHDDDRS